MKATKETALQRLFAASVKVVKKTWPGFETYTPAPATNKTDENAVKTLQSTQEDLDRCWADCEAKTATTAQFEAVLAKWRVARLWAAGIFAQEGK